MLKVGLIGASGKMAPYVIKEIIACGQLSLSYALVRKDSILLGKDCLDYFNLGKSDVIFSDNMNMWDKVDAVIDFSSNELSMQVARLCAHHKKIHIIGTTSMSDQQIEELKELSKNTRIVFSYNMSFGVNLVKKLVHIAASYLSDEFDVEILETHHRYKKDAPSGTAIMFAQAVGDARNVDLEEKAVYSRNGSNCLRKKGDIGFAVVRGGNSIFEHNVMFISDEERIEIIHKATNRSIYAKGSISSLLWVQNMPNGIYSLQDMFAV